MPAKDLYISPWFQKAKRYVEALEARWAILSAEYGLLSPEEPIEPYDTTLNSMPIKERREWATRVIEQVMELDLPGESVVLLAGAKYREFLLPLLEEKGLAVEVPMRGLGIGQQLQWLKEETEAVSR